MGTKPKTRIVATVNGDLRQLFSVRAVAGSGLLISPSPSLNSHIDPRSNRRATESHFSVHMTNGGADTCITHKLAYEDGNRRSLVTFIEGTRERLLYPVFFRLEQPTAPEPEMLLKQKDRNIQVAHWCNLFTSLAYSVFVTNIKGDLQVSADNFQFFDVEFSFFRLFVLVSYADVPSLYDDIWVHSGSRYIDSGEFIDPQERSVVTSIAGQRMFELHRGHSIAMINKQIDTAYNSPDWRSSLLFAVDKFGAPKLLKESAIKMSKANS